MKLSDFKVADVEIHDRNDNADISVKCLSNVSITVTLRSEEKEDQYLTFCTTLTQAGLIDIDLATGSDYCDNSSDFSVTDIETIKERTRIIERYIEYMLETYELELDAEFVHDDDFNTPKKKKD